MSRVRWVFFGDSFRFVSGSMITMERRRWFFFCFFLTVTEFRRFCSSSIFRFLFLESFLRSFSFFFRDYSLESRFVLEFIVVRFFKFRVFVVVILIFDWSFRVLSCRFCRFSWSLWFFFFRKFSFLDDLELENFSFDSLVFSRFIFVFSFFLFRFFFLGCF